MVLGEHTSIPVQANAATDYLISPSNMVSSVEPGRQWAAWCPSLGICGWKCYCWWKLQVKIVVHTHITEPMISIEFLHYSQLKLEPGGMAGTAKFLQLKATAAQSPVRVQGWHPMQWPQVKSFVAEMKSWILQNRIEQIYKCIWYKNMLCNYGTLLNIAYIYIYYIMLYVGHCIFVFLDSQKIHQPLGFLTRLNKWLNNRIQLASSQNKSKKCVKPPTSTVFVINGETISDVISLGTLLKNLKSQLCPQLSGRSFDVHTVWDYSTIV